MLTCKTDTVISDFCCVSLRKSNPPLIISVAMRVLVMLIAISSSDAFCPPMLLAKRSAVVASCARSEVLAMLAGRNNGGTATRREVVSGDSLYKSFVKSGGGEALLAVIAASIAAYGGTRRDALKDEVLALDTSSTISATPHVPLVVLSPSGANRRVGCEVTAPIVALPDKVDYIWLKDVDSGEVLAAKKVSSGGQQQAVLSLALEKGRRAQPVVHCSDGITIGDQFIAAI